MPVFCTVGTNTANVIKNCVSRKYIVNNYPTIAMLLVINVWLLFNATSLGS